MMEAYEQEQNRDFDLVLKLRTVQEKLTVLIIPGSGLRWDVWLEFAIKKNTKHADFRSNRQPPEITAEYCRALHFIVSTPQRSETSCNTLASHHIKERCRPFASLVLHPSNLLAMALSDCITPATLDQSIPFALPTCFQSLVLQCLGETWNNTCHCHKLPLWCESTSLLYVVLRCG